MDTLHKVIENPEGGTLSLSGGDLPVTGYYVGGLVSPLIIPDPEFTPDAGWGVEVFVNYLRETVGAGYIGWWTDEETGKLYIDGTTWHETYDDAEQVTRDRGEIAFWDIERQREFRPVIIKEQ